MSKKKILIITVVMIAALSAGAGTSFLFNSYQKTKSKKVDEQKNDSFEKTLDEYVDGLNKWDYDKIQELTYVGGYYDYYDNDGVFWNKIKGKVKKTEIVDDSDDSKLVKITLNIKDPSLTALKKGKNEKYIYISKYYKDREDKENCWLASLMVDSPDDIKVSYNDIDDYLEYHDSGIVDYTPDEYLSNTVTYIMDKEVKNLGLGLADIEADELESITGFSINNDSYFDLDNDGKYDHISYINENLYINRHENNEACFSLDNLGISTYRIMDFDEYDNCSEIVLDVTGTTSVLLEGDEVPVISPYSIVLRYDGKKLYEFDRCCAKLNSALKGDTKYTASWDNLHLSEIPVKIKKNKIELSKDWIEYKTYYSYDYVVRWDIEAYKKADKKSEKVSIKSGTYLFFTRLKIDEAKDSENVSFWLEAQDDEGNKYYFYFSGTGRFDTYNMELKADNTYDGSYSSYYGGYWGF
ncbi:MAG: hypothetical protein K6G26_02475 [Lachnospiraceae bacterium]|nr:hypothetical protein [Lachnospiraceae bacterium]